MIFDNINIQSSNNNYVYMIGYDRTSIYTHNDKVKYKNINGDIVFFDENIEYMRTNNTYIPCDTNLSTTEYLPKLNDNKTVNIRLSTINLYFPRFSLDTYVDNALYALSVCTWINGKKIDLGTTIINRIDAIANNNPKLFAEDDYYEYIPIDILDPYDMIYSNEWANFRKNVCGSKEILNNTGSFLYCVLQPIEKTNNNSYILLDGYTGGQNSLNINTGDENKYLDLSISDNIDIDEGKKSANIYIKFDLTFNDKIGDLNSYLKKTYNIEAKGIYYELILHDKNNIYNELALSDLIEDLNTTSYIFDKSKITQFKDFTMESYKDGLRFSGAAIITSKEIILNEKNKIENPEDILLYIVSNDIILSREKFNYFLNQLDTIDCVNLLELQDMNITEINAINKIENKVIQIDKPGDSKSNIIMPVFFKVNDLASIIVHPAVNENICINLDVYKSKVDSFIIQIEGIQFSEIGRTESGVIFKIIGKKLPQLLNNGIYYILNQDQDMIVSGKYKYEV